MTHLDNGGEVRLARPRQSGGGSGGGSPPHQACQRTRRGAGTGSQHEGSLSRFSKPRALPAPSLPPSCSLCQIVREGASLLSPLVWFGQSPRTRVAGSRSLPPCC